MSKNVFTVDLGRVKLEDEHRTAINKAIQTAVTNELANISHDEQLAFIPVRYRPIGPILQGIIAMPLDDIFIKNLEQNMGF